MKTDNYLNLCLGQAVKSPLHYRHGCIIVRGGKVIGQGYNDYRPRFNGGALKTGRLAAGSLDGPAIAEPKTKHKRKYKQKPQNQEKHGRLASGTTKTASTFTPFESMGGASYANVPLSMHSEMMAIHSALSASATLSSTAFSREKPCFKLPGASKRKSKALGEALRAYVAQVCELGTTKTGAMGWQVQECGFEPLSSRPGRGEQGQRLQVGGVWSCGRQAE
ncbi:hypothetical protein M8818_007803 [Zalaria obscura]|uniref:Uncharacterized protein n=1 Tax=Zalaria obscura TaxID=2024903 RepID=A0ACC3S364_9PEZI